MRCLCLWHVLCCLRPVLEGLTTVQRSAKAGHGRAVLGFFKAKVLPELCVHRDVAESIEFCCLVVCESKIWDRLYPRSFQGCAELFRHLKC